MSGKVKALLIFLMAFLFNASPAIGNDVVSLGLDTSFKPTLTQYKTIKKAGYNFVGRYLEISPRTKAETYGGKIYFVTKEELKNAKAAGVELFLIFEWCSSRETFLPKTYTRGVRDGIIAKAALKSLGLPASTVVYFSLDRLYNKATTQQVLEYFKGVKRSLGSARYTGVYGNKEWLLALKKGGLASYLWYAPWMDGNNISPIGWGAHMYQKTVIKYVDGIPFDQNFAFTTTFGQVK